MSASHVRQAVNLYSNNCMGIGLGRLSNGRLSEWSSYRGGHICRFGCICKEIYKISRIPKTKVVVKLGVTVIIMVNTEVLSIVKIIFNTTRSLKFQ